MAGINTQRLREVKAQFAGYTQTLKDCLMAVHANDSVHFVPLVESGRAVVRVINQQKSGEPAVVLEGVVAALFGEAIQDQVVGILETAIARAEKLEHETINQMRTQIGAQIREEREQLKEAERQLEEFLE